MTFFDEEKRQALNRLQDICDAVSRYPGNVDPVLAGTDLLELLRLAEFVGRVVHVDVTRRIRIGNSPKN